MALMHVDFYSESLGYNVNCEVIIPQQSRTLIGMETSRGETFRTLYLLHGYSDDCTIWQRRTSVERYVAGRNMAVVMPSADLSWYTDMKYGGAFRTYIADELPNVMRSFFNGMSDKREDNFIAGLSMGGYGAMKLGLQKPENYGGIASFSGALDVYKQAKTGTDYWKSVFGDVEKIPGSENDVYYLAEKVKKEGKTLPGVYIWCGTEDSLIGQARQMNELLTGLGYNVKYSETPGNHNWKYWDEQLVCALDFFDTLYK
ncbi:MAG: esterase family protein [Clostridia bacterium]|nr:esterase family protein [Clostridia bacterium]